MADVLGETPNTPLKLPLYFLLKLCASSMHRRSLDLNHLSTFLSGDTPLHSKHCLGTSELRKAARTRLAFTSQ